MTDLDWLAQAAWERLDGTPQIEAFYSEIPGVLNTGYAVYWPTLGRQSADRAGGGATAFRWGFRIVCAGWTPAQVIGTANRVRPRFRNYQLDPSPEASPLIEEFLDAPLLRDKVEGDTRYSSTLGYYLTTRS